MKKKVRKVIITGANGFVGSALCREFSDRGIRVIAVVKDENSNIASIQRLSNIEIVRCDLTHIFDLPRIIESRDIDLFYHFAWKGTSGSERSDYDIQTDNIRFTCDAVKACKALECNRFIYAASIMEYEIVNEINKEYGINPNEIYSTAKLAADYMGLIIAETFGVEYLAGVISNVFGPGEISPRLINSSLRKMLNNEHCSFSSGEQMYDFIYIDDAVRAFRAIGEKGCKGRRYYIGSSAPQPLKDFLVQMKDQIDSSIRLGLGEIPSRNSTLSYNEFDRDALKKDTGFEPEVSFEEGIQRTIKWLRERNNDRV